MAITSVTYRPSYLSPGYNPIIWTFRSNQFNSYQQYKYVVDIYVDGVFVSRLKQRPNPEGYCTIDVSAIVQPFLDPSEEPSFGSPSYLAPYSTNEDASRHVYIKVGEEFLTEDGVQSSLTIFPGTNTGIEDPGDPAYSIYSSFNATGTRYEVPVHVWPASLDYQRLKYHLTHSNVVNFGNLEQNNGGYFTINPFNNNGNGNPIRVNYWSGNPNTWDTLRQMPLTYRGCVYANNNDAMIPMDMYVGSNILPSGFYDQGEKIILSYINWNPARFDYGIQDFGQQDSTIFSFSFEICSKEDPDTVLASLVIPVVTTSGSGPRIDCTDIILNEEDAKYDIVHVKIDSDFLENAYVETGLSPADTFFKVTGWGRPKILDISGADCNEPLVVYNVWRDGINVLIEAQELWTSDPLYVAPPITKPVRINFNSWCDNLFPRMTLEWLNELGGIDHMPFTAMVEKETQIEGNIYSTDIINWSTSAPFITSSSDLHDPYAGADKSYNKTATFFYTIQSDWLVQEEVDILEGLLKSPRVLGTLTPTNTSVISPDLILLSKQSFSCNIVDKSYSTKLVKAQKLVQATFKIRIPITQNIQNT